MTIQPSPTATVVQTNTAPTLAGSGHFWPIWPMLGWGIGLFSTGAVTLGGRRHDR
ncbi:2TM domain-containing protein [Ornithinimicrobium sp. Y1694]|uniref:2TM domain-containing protein n=1 Tax=Ornithinimicrobium sp. Y1694 TaxID=3418590 RepID=UPI003CEC9CCD